MMPLMQMRIAAAWVVVTACFVMTTFAQPATPDRPRNGPLAAGLEAFDEVVPALMDEYGFVGGAIAVVKDGRLLVARGYGFANIEGREPVRPESLFSIAGCSKSITAVAVMKLAQDGKLDLDAKITEVLTGIRPPPWAQMDARWREITVREVLYHAGGWNSEESGDAVHFGRRAAQALSLREPVSQRELLRYAMTLPLDFDSGTEQHYSNFGYAVVLRLVIEQIAGKDLESFVKESVLLPMGIEQMRIEEPAPKYAPGEVRRYSLGGRRELAGGHQHLRGPAGSWLASPVDLARFMSSVSGARGEPVLSDDTLAQMLRPLDGVLERRNGSHFGMGWDVVEHRDEAQLYGKNGSGAGILAWIEHHPDGVDWVILFNSMHDAAPHEPTPIRSARDEMNRLIGQTTEWPDANFFE